MGNSNTVKTARKVVGWRSTDGILDVAVPKKREIDKPADEFMNIPDNMEELPF